MSRKPVWSIQIRQFDEPLATIRCDKPNGIESESETLMVHLVSDSGDIYPLAGVYGLPNHELKIVPCCDSNGIVNGTKYHPPTEEKHSTTLKVMQHRKVIAEVVMDMSSGAGSYVPNIDLVLSKDDVDYDIFATVFLGEPLEIQPYYGVTVAERDDGALPDATQEYIRLAMLSPSNHCSIADIVRLVRTLGLVDTTKILTVDELSDALDYVEVANAVVKTPEVE